MSPDIHNTRATDRADVQQRDVAFARSAPAWGRWVSWIVALILASNFLWLVATNPNFEWKVVLQWFTEESVLKGLIAEHHAMTDSRWSGAILEDWDRAKRHFQQVVPKEMLTRLSHPLTDEATVADRAEVAA